MKSHLVQRHGHDCGFEGVGGRAVNLRARDGGDVTPGNRLTHDEELGQAGVKGIAHPRIGNHDTARAVEQIHPFLFRALKFILPVLLPECRNVVLIVLVRANQPGHAGFARLEIPLHGQYRRGRDGVFFRANSQNHDLVSRRLPARQQMVGSSLARSTQAGL